MASDDTMTIQSSIHEDDDDVDDANNDDDDHHHDQYQYRYHQYHSQHSLSRLSMCSNNSKHYMYDYDDDEGAGGDMEMYMSRLSIECSDGDADEEFSDYKEIKGLSGVSSEEDSDKEPDCYSLPATPRRRRIRRGILSLSLEAKEYASENEAQKGVGRKAKKHSRRRIVRERWLEKAWEEKKNKAVDEEMDHNNNNNMSGESECLVITRPKGGRRSLCMDLEEVKACRDLGFELEHERMLEIPSRISISGSTVDTSSGGNSPIANWRISSPGDDPRDVKARLKVWAQAVALASASRLVN